MTRAQFRKRRIVPLLVCDLRQRQTVRIVAVVTQRTAPGPRSVGRPKTPTGDDSSMLVLANDRPESLHLQLYFLNHV